MDEMGGDGMDGGSARAEALRMIIELLDRMEAERLSPAPEAQPEAAAPEMDPEESPEALAALKAKLEEMDE